MTLPGITELDIRLRVAGASDAGQARPENQDSFLIEDLTTSLIDDASQGAGRLPREAHETREIALGSTGALLMFADGMGGAASGRLAGRMATAHVLDSLTRHWVTQRGPSPERFVSCLRSAVEASNALIHEQSNMHPSYMGMGTTATVAGVLGDYVYLAQVGDSRAYLVRDGVCTQLTKDQSFANYALEMGVMSPDQVESSPQRNTLLQALGPSPTVDVDVTYQHLRRGDVLVLCSDGLFRVVTEEEIAEMAAQSLEGACERLVDLANERGSPDNVTVVVARFFGDGLDLPQRRDAVGHQPI
ncbi:MAG: PP2C family protein-serine/threonine phosphatase [Longimicrobiales bacterium]